MRETKLKLREGRACALEPGRAPREYGEEPEVPSLQRARRRKAQREAPRLNKALTPTAMRQEIVKEAPLRRRGG